MSHISVAVEYALHGLAYLVDWPEATIAPSARDIAELRQMPVKYVSAIMTKLHKAGIVTSTEGVRGGIRLSRAPENITFFDVVVAVDGMKPLFDCRDVRHGCALFGADVPTWATSGVCSIHAVMLEAEARMNDVLKQRTLRMMSDASVRRVPPAFREEGRNWLRNRGATRG